MQQEFVIKLRYVLLAGLFAVTLAFEDSRIADALRQHKELTAKRSEIGNVKAVLSEIDDDLENVQSKICMLSGSTDPACSGYAVKRSDADAADMFSQKDGNRILKDLARKRAALQFLKKLLMDENERNGQVIKRNCLVNLGGHCATETAAAIADMYHYLNSAESPGRKKRSASNLLRKALRKN
ncbi:uncharacterized protein LOC135492019 isoform X2 [Lineus longissimus]|uniref:uncharacterized protein LOC135492019 isoform X2 n=1 Tax=Lineus longissimus TaxID=88925 RepID=UPI002B4F4723